MGRGGESRLDLLGKKNLALSQPVSGSPRSTVVNNTLGSMINVITDKSIIVYPRKLF